jgi:predicted TPR repeat methyltransferase
MKSDDRDGRADYFDDLYANNPDPWNYRSGAYEIRKRVDTLSFLKDHYRSGCEVGCSIGVLTEELAPRCDRLVGVDVSETAAQIARQRLARLPHVQIKVLHLPHQDIEDRFDLLVLSEMLYFLTEAEIAGLAEIAARRVVAGGDLLIVNYDGETQTRLGGKESSAEFVGASAAAFEMIRAEQREHYHVRLLRRRHDGV